MGWVAVAVAWARVVRSTLITARLSSKTAHLTRTGQSEATPTPSAVQAAAVVAFWGMAVPANSGEAVAAALAAVAEKATTLTVAEVPAAEEEERSFRVVTVDLRRVAAAQAAIYAAVAAVASITLTLMRRIVPAAVVAALALASTAARVF